MGGPGGAKQHHHGVGGEGRQGEGAAKFLQGLLPLGEGKGSKGQNHSSYPDPLHPYLPHGSEPL